jgi:hypothetical protein
MRRLGKSTAAAPAHQKLVSRRPSGRTPEDVGINRPEPPPKTSVDTVDNRLKPNGVAERAPATS